MPCGEWHDLGVELDAPDRRSSFSSTATGASGVLAVARKPGGGSVIASKWLIHTSCSSGMSACSSDESAVRVRCARPYSPRMPRPTVPPSWGDQLGPVADAEDRHAEVVDRRVELWGALDVHALRAHPTG
jgi:hypothetical protein